jgi:hypothetical protein
MSDQGRETPELKGTALRVYLVLLKKGEYGAGPRAIQKELELSSPNAVVYHLERLISLGLVEKDLSGNYKAKKEATVEVFTNFVIFFGALLPKYLLYAIFFTTMLLTFVVIYPYRPNAAVEYVVALIFGLSACIIMWYETINIWRRRPF